MNTYSEWYNSLSRIIANHYAHCSRDELAEACFKAGYEAGKSFPMPPDENGYTRADEDWFFSDKDD